MVTGLQCVRTIVGDGGGRCKRWLQCYNHVMVTAKSFLDTIIADPHNDTLKLVYAEWLEEHDKADLAEIIRLECEYATLPNRQWKRRQDVWRRLRVLRDREFSNLWRRFSRLEIWKTNRGLIAAMCSQHKPSQWMVDTTTELQRFHPIAEVAFKDVLLIDDGCIQFTYSVDVTTPDWFAKTEAERAKKRAEIAEYENSVEMPLGGLLEAAEPAV